MARKISRWRGYGYAWITLGLFLFSLAGHWLFGWFAYVDEQTAHGQPIEVGGYTVLMLRDTLENWQSEFLQLVWQAAGLALFYFWGSSQSKEGDERLEAKVDRLLREQGIDPASRRSSPSLDCEEPQK